MTAEKANAISAAGGSVFGSGTLKITSLEDTASANFGQMSASYNHRTY